MSEPLPPPPTEYFFERFPWNNRWILFAIALVVACFDYLAGPIVFFPILFVVPVALMAWNCGLRTALILGAILCVIRFSIQYAWGIPYTLPVAIINACVRLAILFIITFLCGKLSEQTQALRARVRTLEGLLPTCAFCKDIRDEDGNWHQIEQYVASRSEARFTHGICPKCVTTHYGDILNMNTNDTGPPAA
jgi:K+-sensing histidine kinase KdpD